MNKAREADPATDADQRRRSALVLWRWGPSWTLLAVTFLLINSPAAAQKRREALLRLREDVATAVAHVSLNEKQTQTLDRCQQTVLLAAQSGRARKTVRPRDLHGALREIEKTVREGPFQTTDQTLVQQDIDQVRLIEQNRRKRPRQRARLPIPTED